MPLQSIPLMPKTATYFSNKSTLPLTNSQANTLLADARNVSSDDVKYQTAVDMARMKFQDNETVDESIFKDTIDNYYEQMNPEKTAREMRGENSWTDFVGSAKDAINGFNTAIGSGIDYVFDNTFGNLVGLVNEDAGDKVKGFMSGEDLAIIPDIATDMALYASGVGIPVALAKNAIQLSDYMGSAVSGKDSLTLEDLDAGQRAANAALGFGGTLLSAVPGVGKGVNIAKTASKDAAKKTANEAMKGADKAIVDSIRNGTAAPGLVSPNDLKAINALDNLDKTTFQRVIDTMAQDASGLLRAGTVDIPSQIGKGFREARNLGSLRGIAKEANKVAKDSNKTAAEIFSQLAKKEGKDVSKFVSKDAAGRDVFRPPVRSLSPAGRAKARKEGTELAKEEIDAAEKMTRKKRKALKNEYRQLATEAAQEQQPLAVSKISGLIPGSQVVTRGTRNSFQNVLDNMLKRSSSYGRALDDTQAKELQEAMKSLTGRTKGDAISKQAKDVGGRILSTAGGMGAGVLSAPLAYYAQGNGDDYFDAGANWFRDLRTNGNYGQVLPMLLPLGTKSVSRRINPGIRGNLNSSIPHMAMRAPATAARMDNGTIGYDTDNEGFSAAVERLLAS